MHKKHGCQQNYLTKMSGRNPAKLSSQKCGVQLNYLLRASGHGPAKLNLLPVAFCLKMHEKHVCQQNYLTRMSGRGPAKLKLLLTALLSNEVKKYGYQLRYLPRTSGYGPAKVNLHSAAFPVLCLISHIASLFNIHLTKEGEKSSKRYLRRNTGFGLAKLLLVAYHVFYLVSQQTDPIRSKSTSLENEKNR